MSLASLFLMFGNMDSIMFMNKYLGRLKVIKITDILTELQATIKKKTAFTKFKHTNTDLKGHHKRCVNTPTLNSGP